VPKNGLTIFMASPRIRGIELGTSFRCPPLKGVSRIPPLRCLDPLITILEIVAVVSAAEALKALVSTVDLCCTSIDCKVIDGARAVTAEAEPITGTDTLCLDFTALTVAAAAVRASIDRELIEILL
ncbi:MAG: hypothetical protein AB7O44_24990, partial [Hyphomicrobiaceae bacterium]